MTKRKEQSEKLMTGPKAMFRGKCKVSKSVQLDEAGMALLKKEVRDAKTGDPGRTGLSISDYFQYLLMNFGHRVPGRRESKRLIKENEHEPARV